MRGCCAARATGAARAPPFRPRASPKCRASSVIEPGTSSGNPAPRKPVPQTLPPRDRNFDPFTPPPDASTFPPCNGNPDYFRFEVVHRSTKSNARVGRIHTPHGVIETPGFVAVGTMGALKHVSHQSLQKANLDLMFSNTYHLMLQPGADLVEAAGGLHKFIGRDAPIITDSGGFQVFSLDKPDAEDGKEMKSRRPSKQKGEAGLLLRKNENGVLFKSYRDGREVALTPESSVAAQKQLGADIIIPLDELPPYCIDPVELKKADPKKQAMYGVIHGGVDKNLRKLSAAYLTSLPFDGFAIGGSLGRDSAELLELLVFLMPLLPTEKPNHLLGIGDVPSIEGAVPLGVDTFDSTFPTRNARHGSLLLRNNGNINNGTSTRSVNVLRAEYSSNFSPPCTECECALCANHTFSYLHHLFKANEPNAVTLAATHNLHHMGWLMGEKRKAILRNEI